MSNSDSFIDEVTEEVRRDRLYNSLKRYGWIGILVVLLIVGGAAFTEYRKVQARAEAQAFGTALLSALEAPEASDRIAALEQIDAPGADALAVQDMLIAAEEAQAVGNAEAAARLSALATGSELSPIYREIARYKALTHAGGTMSADERRIGFEALTGGPLRLLAEEQLALIEIETGNPDAAVTRLQKIITDAEVSQGLRRRATQLIVALGGLPETA